VRAWVCFQNYTRQTMFVLVLGSIEARSGNHCCNGKALSITYSECVFLALGVQHVVHMRHIVMWSARLYDIFSCYPINGMIFLKNLLYKKCVFLSTPFVWNTSETLLIPTGIEWDTNNNVYRSSCKSTGCFCLIWMKLEFSWSIFEYLNIKFH
jgi:hypothetical protein